MSGERPCQLTTPHMDHGYWWTEEVVRTAHCPGVAVQRGPSRSQTAPEPREPDAGTSAPEAVSGRERVQRFVDAWPQSGQHPDDIYGLWVHDEDQPRVLRKSDLVALLAAGLDPGHEPEVEGAGEYDAYTEWMACSCGWQKLGPRGGAPKATDQTWAEHYRERAWT